MIEEEKIKDALEQQDEAALRALIEGETDKDISHIKGLSQYLRLHLLDLKYGHSIIGEARLKGGKFRRNKATVLNLRTRSMISIKAFYAEGDDLIIQGVHNLEAAGREYRLAVTDQNGNDFPAVSVPYERADIRGITGDVIVRGMQYKASVPMKDKMRITLSVEIEGQKVTLDPAIDKYIGFDSELENSFVMRHGFIIKHEGDSFLLTKDSLLSRLKAERALEGEIRKVRGAEAAEDKKRELKLKKRWEKATLQNRVAFVSVRADGRLLGNMEKVYEALDLPKAQYAKMKILNFPDDLAKATELVMTSKVVVTDDYLAILRDNEKKPGQKYIQLWHATGSGKHFGQDGTNLFPPTDTLYHRGYDLVTVSSEGIRDVYAGAFGINPAKVVAAGVPRTDDFFDEEYISRIHEEIYRKHPEFAGREIIIYTPTFRDIPGTSRKFFAPELDFDKLSEVIGDGRMFVICPHPVMTEPILGRSYDNIIELRDVSTNDMMFVSDLMITDYSSTMFEYSLLRKPMVFFCYDYDSYDREFYMDFDKELPGRMLRTQEELFDYLSKGDFAADSEYDEFYRKYMSACDGHSTERVAALIRQIYNS